MLHGKSGIPCGLFQSRSQVVKKVACTGEEFVSRITLRKHNEYIFIIPKFQFLSSWITASHNSETLNTLGLPNPIALQDFTVKRLVPRTHPLS